MTEGESKPVPVSEWQRLEWIERIESYARDAAPRTRPFAEAVVTLAPPPRGGRVLDVATGTGLVAVEAARRVGPAGSVLATDFLPAWEPYVRETATAAGVTNVAFAAMPAEALAVADASFDVVFCQFGLMFMPDPVRALREMRRVLRPDGRLGVAVWSVPENVGIFLLSRIVGPALPPAEGEAPLSPMGMSAPGSIEGLIAEAGFHDVVVQRATRFHEIVDPETEWRRWTEQLSTPASRGLASLAESERRRLHDKAIAALETFREGDVIRVPSEAILVTAVR